MKEKNQEKKRNKKKHVNVESIINDLKPNDNTTWCRYNMNNIIYIEHTNNKGFLALKDRKE